MRRTIFFILGSLALSLHATAAAAQPSPAIDVSGLWLTETGNSHIKITGCSDGAPCGAIAWIDPATDGSGLDEQNPDPDLRGRPLLGLTILWGFERSGDKWRNGKIYDPESGKTYRSVINLRDDGGLKVKGCVGPICQGQRWTRVDDETMAAQN